MALFDNLVINMQNLGMFQYLFPFLLALAIFYGVMEYAFKDRIKKGPVGLISVVLAFFVMLFANTNPMIAGFFANLGGMTLVVGSGLLVVIILLGLAGFQLNKVFEKGYMMWFFVFVLILIGVIVFFGAGGGNLVAVPSFIVNSDFTTVVIVIIIIALAMWFMTHEGEKQSAAASASGGGRPS
jgi:hypothetical protein